MKTPTWLLRSLLATTTLALIFGLVLWRHRSRHDANPATATPAPGSSAHDARVSPESRLPSVGPARETEFRTRPAPPSLTRAYPDIKALPADWHDHNHQAQTITVAPYPDLPLTFTRTAVKDEGKYVTWFGTVADIPGSSLISVAGPTGSQTAVLIMPGTTQYTFITAPDGTTNVIGADPGDEGCGNSVSTPNRTVSVGITTSLQFKANYAAAAKLATDAGFGTGQALGAPANADANTIFVDVLFLYNATAKQSAAYLNATDPVGFLDTYSKACIESGNVVLNNSLITNFQWRYLTIEQVPDYTEQNVATDPLDAITNFGAIGNWVTSEAYKKGADQVMYWWSSRTNTKFSAAGVAWAGDANALPVEKIYARAVSTFAADAQHAPATYKTVIHELSHNFGCDHDRAHAGASFENPSGTPAQDGDGRYGYGQFWSNAFTLYYRHNLDGTPDTSGGTYTITLTDSTIMGYGAGIIPYFSNPNIRIDVTYPQAPPPPGIVSPPAPDFGVQNLGTAIGEPRAAYNAKVLADNAAKISTFNDPITTPAITAQPHDVSATSGGNISLSVTATGGGLSYQWKKDGVEITNATASLYQKTAATSDAGKYTVVVSNLNGFVTSNAATVTVSVGSSGNGSSGSGGGGAPSYCLLLWLVLLATFRLIRRR